MKLSLAAPGQRSNPYVPDLFSPNANLIIEPDGSQHWEQEEYDEERTKYLGSQGDRVIHFGNNEEVNDIHGVILAMLHPLEDREKR